MSSKTVPELGRLNNKENYETAFFKRPNLVWVLLAHNLLLKVA